MLTAANLAAAFKGDDSDLIERVRQILTEQKAGPEGCARRLRTIERKFSDQEDANESQGSPGSPERDRPRD